MNQLAVIERPQAPAFTLSDMERIATSIARGGMFGSKDPHAVLTLCMLAQAEGQHPAVVFRDYDIIQGKPAKKAEAMLRDFIGSGGKVTWNRLDDECADATFSHPQGGTVTINWTLARATKAGLGGKDMWKKYPRQMLRSRVVSEGVRTVCPNATSGLYVPEEVRDFGHDTTPADTPPTPEAKRARDLKGQSREPAAKQIEAGTNGNGREKAEAWVDEFEQIVRQADTPEALGDIADEAAPSLAKLEKAHPDLHARAKGFADARADQLASEPEGPADSQRGETHNTPDDHPSRQVADEIVSKLKRATSPAKVDQVMAENVDHLSSVPDDVRSEVAEAEAAARVRLGGEG